MLSAPHKLGDELEAVLHVQQVAYHYLILASVDCGQHDGSRLVVSWYNRRHDLGQCFLAEFLRLLVHRVSVACYRLHDVGQRAHLVVGLADDRLQQLLCVVHLLTLGDSLGLFQQVLFGMRFQDELLAAVGHCATSTGSPLGRLHGAEDPDGGRRRLFQRLQQSLGRCVVGQQLLSFVDDDDAVLERRLET
ncbi:hypothetical protein D3C86_1414540 [compost metagenome]